MPNIPAFLTYLHCTPDGTPFYVGQGSWKRAHVRSVTQRRNQYYRDVVKKYGATNILVFVFPCDSRAQAKADEVHHIAQLRAEGYRLANITDGGDIARIKSSAERAKLSRALTGRKFTPEWREKMSIAAQIRWHQEMLKPDTRQRLIAMANKRWGN